MKEFIVNTWRKVRGYAAALAFMAFGSSLFAEGGAASSYTPDFTEATTAITAVSSGIIDWIKGTLMGKIIAVVVVFVVLRLSVWAIRYFGRGGSR